LLRSASLSLPALAACLAPQFAPAQLVVLVGRAANQLAGAHRGGGSRLSRPLGCPNGRRNGPTLTFYCPTSRWPALITFCFVIVAFSGPSCGLRARLQPARLGQLFEPSERERERERRTICIRALPIDIKPS